MKKREGSAWWSSGVYTNIKHVTPKGVSHFIWFMLLVIIISLLNGGVKVLYERNEISDQQLAEERAKAVQVASKIRVPHGVFLVSKQEIIWLTQWDVKKWDVIQASLESGMGVPMSGVIFSPTDEWYNHPLGMIRTHHLAGVTDVVHPSDCNYTKILTGINKGVYAYPEGLPECE